VAEFDLAAAVQEDTEPDQAGVRRDLGGDLILGPRAGSGGEGDVSSSMERPIKASWARMPFSPFRWLPPARPQNRKERRCIGTWVESRPLCFQFL
jgi:hypothetical protein